MLSGKWNSGKLLGQDGSAKIFRSIPNNYFKNRKNETFLPFGSFWRFFSRKFYEIGGLIKRYDETYNKVNEDM
jgi:hypothetical protein